MPLFAKDRVHLTPRHRLPPFIALASAFVIAPLTENESAVSAQQRPATRGPGRIIFFRQGIGTGQEPGLAAAAPDGKGFTWLVKGNSVDLHTVLSCDGSRIAYGVREGEGKATVHVKEITDRGAGRSLGVRCDYWCWSADGNHLVVSSIGDDIQHQLVNVKTKEAKPLALPDTPAAPGRPSGHWVTDWSPDGQWFLTTYLPPKEDAKPQLYLVKRDGSAARPIGGVEAGEAGRFSPDGKRVLFAGLLEKEHPHLYVVDTAGGKPQRVSSELGGDYMGYCWSPDGKRIAYGWRQGPEQQGGNQGITESFLMIVNADGSNPQVRLSEKTSNSAGTITLAVLDWR